MKIERHVPQSPPSFQMTFTRDEGWAIVAALHHYAEHHPDARDKELWHSWGAELNKKLRA